MINSPSIDAHNEVLTFGREERIVAELLEGDASFVKLILGDRRDVDGAVRSAQTERAVFQATPELRIQLAIIGNANFVYNQIGKSDVTPCYI